MLNALTQNSVTVGKRYSENKFSVQLGTAIQSHPTPWFYHKTCEFWQAIYCQLVGDMWPTSQWLDGTNDIFLNENKCRKKI